MKIKFLVYSIFLLSSISCQRTVKESTEERTCTNLSVKIVAAMKDVMWKGQLSSSIDLDTISDKVGLYGLGPVSYLSGEILINNGINYVSKVTSDTTMIVEKTFNTSAPFFVYTNVNHWNEVELPPEVKTIQDLELYIDRLTSKHQRPFAFRLEGTINNATIHVQNLPPGTKVSSPEEAHQGQTNYPLVNVEAQIIGFFSTEHQGVFTHHDSFLHMHLITQDESKMGHLDQLEIDQMKLFLP